MKPEIGFRQGYIYNNVMYMLAGVIIEKIYGKKWEEIVQEKILVPLGMNKTFFGNAHAGKEKNFAKAYYYDDTSNAILEMSSHRTLNSVSAAGAMISNIQDMSKWMMLQINGGKYQDKQIISSNVIRETMIPQSIADKAGLYDELSNSLYGLGRQVYSYKGRKLTSHTGGGFGMFSNLTFSLKDSLGIFVVFNGTGGNSFRPAITFSIIDILFNQSYTPWSSRYYSNNLQSRINAKRNTDSLARLQVKNTVPSHSLNAFTGTYVHPVYGKITITSEKDSLFMAFRAVKIPLHHFHYDQFYTREHPANNYNYRLSFFTNMKGDIDRFEMNTGGDVVVFRK